MLRSLLALLVATIGVGSAPVPGTDYAIIVTGGELLDGSITDAHTPYLARALRPLGLHCIQSTLVDDSPVAMRAALEAATGRARLVFVTGGLGPTVNDVTREVLSSFTGIPLDEESAVLATLAERFAQPVEQLADNLRRQARVPRRGGFLPNTRGTAVGLIFDAPTVTVIALPGPPRELQAMVDEALVSWLRRRLGLHDNGSTLTLRFVGIGQSAIDRTLQENRLVPSNAIVSSRFEGSRVDFAFTFPQATEAGSQQLEELREGVLQHLGRYVYSINHATLEDVALAHLLPKGRSLVVAEPVGPIIAAALTTAAQRSGMTLQSLAATSAHDLRRLLALPDTAWNGASDPASRASLLAQAARQVSGAAWSIATTSPVAVEDGRGAIVWVAVLGPDGAEQTWRLGLRESAEAGWGSLVNELLDRLRRMD